jgi:hypothetical protein
MARQRSGGTAAASPGSGRRLPELFGDPLPRQIVAYVVGRLLIANGRSARGNGIRVSLPIGKRPWRLARAWLGGVDDGHARLESAMGRAVWAATAPWRGLVVAAVRIGKARQAASRRGSGAVGGVTFRGGPEPRPMLRSGRPE